MFCLLLFEIVPFAERSDNIFKENIENAEITSSGSLGQWYEGKCNPTLPSHSVDSVSRKSDWCSNINKSKHDHPWLGLGLRGQSISITGYALRSVCSYYGFC